MAESQYGPDSYTKDGNGALQISFFYSKASLRGTCSKDGDISRFYFATCEHLNCYVSEIFIKQFALFDVLNYDNRPPVTNEPLQLYIKVFCLPSGRNTLSHHDR